jgi:catalase-peroxidase
MGPRARYLGALVPQEELIWQDPIPAVNHPLIDAQDIAALKATILATGLSISQLVSTAWASASTFRGSDKRGGANGARIRLAPQKDWEVNQPAQARARARDPRDDPEGVQRAQTGGKRGLARRPDRAGRVRRDRGGGAKAGVDVTVPFTPGRMDAVAGADRRRVVRRARTDGRRLPQLPEDRVHRVAEELLVDKAQLLTLTAPEMTVLVGGLRVLNANHGQSRTACSPTDRRRSPTTSSCTCSTWGRRGSRPPMPGTSSRGAIARPAT